MLNERINDFVAYCERLQYYALVAFLYEKAENSGYIADYQIYCPSNVGKSEKYEILLKGNCDKSEYEKAAEEFIAKFGLNKAFCDKIKNSKGFRYMVAVGFHDSPIVGHEIGDNYITLSIECENAAFSQPLGVESLATVKFCGVGKFEFCVEKGDKNAVKIDGAYYDRQEFYCTNEGKIRSYITLLGHGGESVETTLEIISDDIEICHK